MTKNLEAVGPFYGDNLYALRRVKDAANAYGIQERKERFGWSEDDA